MNAGEQYPYREWLDKAEEDMEAARILLHNEGPLAAAGFHIQQAFEKYLKGYLLYSGQTPRRIHDLEALLDELRELDGDFATR